MEEFMETLTKTCGQQPFIYLFLLLALMLPGATSHLIFGYAIPSEWPIFLTFCLTFSLPFFIAALLCLGTFPKQLGFRKNATTATQQIFYIALTAIAVYYLVIGLAYIFSLVQGQVSMEEAYYYLTGAMVGVFLLLLLVHVVKCALEKNPKK